MSRSKGLSYRQALAALEARQEARVELGLGRVRRQLGRLGSPHRRLRCFHVAGTNGKGSVCAIMDAVLRAAGHKTGFYSSPHLFDVRERIRVAGRPIPKDAFARLLSRSLDADPRARLTYFELLTCVAFQWFAESGVDAVVLETGLGGRLDATNVVTRPLASVITSIDFDHVQYLGRTRSAIAGEKAGIVKRGRPVFCPPLASSARRVVAAAARKAGSALTIVSRGWPLVSTDWRGQTQTLQAPGLGRVKLSLLGDSQRLNAALAYCALSAVSARLPTPPSAWRRGLARVRWPGRFEVRRLGRKTAILDGAHNAEAMAHLARTWNDSPFSKRPARWIIGVMRDKDARRLLAPIARHISEAVAVRPPNSRALDAESLARMVRAGAPGARVSAESDPAAALRRWRDSGAGPGTAVVCGSFYLVGRAAKVLGAGDA